MSVNSPCLGLNRSIARWTEAHYRKETPADIIVPVALYLVGTVFRNESHRLNPMNKGPGRSRVDDVIWDYVDLRKALSRCYLQELIPT